MDDSQADVLSERSWQDQVPSPGQESYDEPEEMEARVSAALPAADASEFIEAPATGGAEADVPEGYFQRRWHGKQSIKRQIRKFLITGLCKWRGKRISRAELAYTFDQQIISEMERTVKEWKTCWTRWTRPAESARGSKIGGTVQLKFHFTTPDRRKERGCRNQSAVPLV